MMVGKFDPSRQRIVANLCSSFWKRRQSSNMGTESRPDIRMLDLPNLRSRVVNSDGLAENHQQSALESFSFNTP